MKLWKLSLLAVEGLVSLAIALGGGRSEVRSGTMVATMNDLLVVRAADEQAPHTERVSPQSTITRDNKTVRLAELRPGDQLTTTTGDDGRVTSIQASSRQAHETQRVASVAGSQLRSD